MPKPDDSVSVLTVRGEQQKLSSEVTDVDFEGAVSVKVSEGCIGVLERTVNVVSTALTR